jgi:hypothetical protein
VDEFAMAAMTVKAAVEGVGPAVPPALMRALTTAHTVVALRAVKAVKTVATHAEIAVHAKAMMGCIGRVSGPGRGLGMGTCRQAEEECSYKDADLDE